MTELTQNQLAQLHNTMSQDHLQTVLSLGQSQFAEFNEKLAKIARVKLWSEIKNSKSYKGLKLIDEDGNWRQIATWDDFCQSQGKSRRTVDEEIQNLELFGAGFFEVSKKIGLSTRDLRKLRKLPDDERDIIINGEAVQAEDKDSLIDLIEEISAKHAKTKAELEQQVQDLTADNQAKDKVMATKDKKINTLDTKLSLRKDPAQAHLHAQAVEQHITDEMQQASSAVLTAIGSFNTAMLTLKQQASDDAPHLLEKIGNDISFVYNRIAELAVTEGIDIDLSELVTPSWMNDISDSE